MLARTHTKGNIYTLWWKYEMVLTTTKISGSSKKHNRLILRPSIPPLSIYQRTPNEHMKETHISFIGLVTITQLWKQPRCPSEKWTKKMWYTDTVGFIAATKKKEIVFAEKWGWTESY